MLAHLLFTNVFCLSEQLQEIRRKIKAKEILFVEIFFFLYDFFF